MADACERDEAGDEGEPEDGEDGEDSMHKGKEQSEGECDLEDALDVKEDEESQSDPNSDLDKEDTLTALHLEDMYEELGLNKYKEYED